MLQIRMGYSVMTMTTMMMTMMMIEKHDEVLVKALFPLEEEAVAHSASPSVRHIRVSRGISHPRRVIQSCTST